MAGTSRFPPLLDFDEQEIEFAVENSLHDSQSTSEDEESNLDEALHDPNVMLEDLTRKASNSQMSGGSIISPGPTRATTDRPLSARRGSIRSARYLNRYGITSEGESSAWGSSARRSSNIHQPLDVPDPLTEMQALRARMDVLQSLIPPSNQHTVLETSQSEDEQPSSQLHATDDPTVIQSANWNDLSGESGIQFPSSPNRPRRSLQQRASRDPFPLILEKSWYRQQRRSSMASHMEQSNLSAAQNQHVSGNSPSWCSRIRANVEVQLAAGLPNRKLLYYYKPSSGARFVESQSLSSAVIPSQLYKLPAPNEIPNMPEEPPVGRFYRGQSLRPLLRTASSTTTQQPNLIFGQKRRRVAPEPSISRMSEQESLDDWNDFASNARAREELLSSPGLTLAASQGQYQGYKSRSVTSPVYPTSPFMPGANVVFLSQLLPQCFNPSERLQILSIIRANAHYVPLCVLELDPSALQSPTIKRDAKDILDTKDKQEPSCQHPLGPNGMGWPTNGNFDGEHPQSLPVEIFELIGSLLPRDSIQSMRLVNRDFERKISCFAFKSVVVPFKPKIYETASTQMSPKAMGKQKALVSEPENSVMIRQTHRITYNPRENHVKDGMRVFEEWGPEIKKFALTFEVAEEDLTKLRPKRRFEVTNTFWGSYRWPHTHYNRYEQAAKLEQKADETSAMTNAFSKLTGVRELGLSVLSGLGWLAGRDMSDRVKLFRKKPVVFGPQHIFPDRELRQNIQKWEAITKLETSASKRIRNKAGRGFFKAVKEVSSVNNLPRVYFRNVSDDNIDIFPPMMFDNENLEAKEISRADFTSEDGAMEGYNVPSTPSESSGVIPNALTSEQEDWLMEMEWAQGAFLSSWCIALLDNPDVFHSLRTLNIANLSSKHLLSLQRDDVWHALPSLQDLTVLVSPDWRRVSKDNQGNVSTEPVRPSSAQLLFWNFLSALFEENKSITSLKIGYIDGGEHASGMYARNQNIIPAPIDQYPYLPSGQTTQETLYLPYIENLILKNCWLTPATLANFFITESAPRLNTIIFDSVSLTANTNLNSLDNDSNNNDLLPATDRSLKWLTAKPLPGSWPDIINTITPGPNIAHARYAHGLLSSPPASPTFTAVKKLQSLQFNSCGYARLPNLHEFDQSSLPELPSGPPQCLRRRWAELQRGMLDGKEDGLLGTVVPCMREEEEGTLRGVWGLELGWTGRWKRNAWQCREDGQAEGGSGRFYGIIRRESD
ncbi:MAG: hypothetical protein Q9209_001737 [Squamulea sp. 1 TL-2023]